MTGLDMIQKTDSPMISVVIPVYNMEAYLRNCLDSVALSTWKDMEIICAALSEIYPVHGRDRTSYRTAEDMAYEWLQHNIAYEFLPESS